MTTALQKIGSVAVTGAGAVAGALAGGPVGLGVGAVAGGIIDLVRAHFAKVAPPPVGAPTALDAVSMAPPPDETHPLVAAAMTPGGAGLPPGADKTAATNAWHLMALGKPAEVTPGRIWLRKFQTSVGLPATGTLDSQTRALLTLAEPKVASLPAATILS